MLLTIWRFFTFSLAQNGERQLVYSFTSTYISGCIWFVVSLLTLHQKYPHDRSCDVFLNCGALGLCNLRTYVTVILTFCHPLICSKKDSPGFAA